ncbi:hypothetical protein [Nonomuraea sp. NPDC003201]
MSVVRRLTSVTALCALAVAVFAVSPANAAAPPPPTEPPDGCWGTGPVAVDPMGVRWQTRYCRAYRTGDVYNHVQGAWTPIGRLNASDSWFVCQAHGPENPPVQQWYNDIWLYTLADEAWDSDGWGSFPATHVTGGVNYGPIPNLPWCPWENTLTRKGVPERTGVRS